MKKTRDGLYVLKNEAGGQHSGRNPSGKRRNYMQEMDEIVSSLPLGHPKPKVLLHVCCAPCFSGCFEVLTEWADLTLFFYNPNMDTLREYERRARELRRFVREANIPAAVIVREFDSQPFYRIARGLENEPEGGARCMKCFELRLRETAEYARDNGFDYFTTTLTLSPHKDADRINEIGEFLGNACGVPFLPSDFKKKDGFLKSVRISEEYGLYRQDYCGCVYSRRDDLA